MKKYIVVIILVVALVSLVVTIIVRSNNNKTSSDNVGASSNDNCNVAAVSISGFLNTESAGSGNSSLQVADAIRRIDPKDKKALLVYMDSPGGMPAAAEEVSDALNEVNLPKVTFVRGAALSSAYWIAASTGHIVALGASTIGSIGITSSYLDEVGLNQMRGYVYHEITTGPYKDAGRVDKPLTAEDKKYIQDTTDKMFQVFLKALKTYRDFSDDQLKAFSDGKYYLADDALKLGLIDQIGGFGDVKAYLAEKTNTSVGDLLICQPVMAGDSGSSVGDKSSQ
ncbi:MAG TPA: S49 family peptidase [Candidatus Paceibacterota bacterium]|nr:S49 family peptidase [Candidatus Paceibacterota bacterium]